MRKMRGARALAMALAVAMMVCGIAGSTLAWLVDKTESVTNTFTYGDINIELKETTGDEYELIPGETTDKDPKVTVKADSEKSYLFVKLVEAGGNVTVGENTYNFDSFIEYSVLEGEDEWIQLKDNEGNAENGVYYRVVDAIPEDGQDAVFQVLAGDDDHPNGKVTMKGSVTKEMLNALTDETYPTLTITAYAAQFENMADVWAAWTAVVESSNT